MILQILKKNIDYPAVFKIDGSFYLGKIFKDDNRMIHRIVNVDKNDIEDVSNYKNLFMLIGIVVFKSK